MVIQFRKDSLQSEKYLVKAHFPEYGLCPLEGANVILLLDGPSFLDIQRC